MYQDPEIAEIIRNLDRKKQECVHGNNPIKSFSFLTISLDEKFDQARKFKQAIQELIKVR
jgi:hypothetical protein